MDYRALFSSVRRRPEMYGVQNSFPAVCAYLNGVDAGTEGKALAGFREYLVLRAGKGNNLVWEGLVRHIAFPGNDHLPSDYLADPDRERHALETLFDVLDDFLATRA